MTHDEQWTCLGAGAGDTDLGLGELKLRAELGALGDGEVLLLAVLLLKRVQLRGRERRARLAVGFVLPEHAAHGPGWRAQGHV